MVAPPVAPREAPHLLLVDTHAHLNDRRFAGDLDAVVERARTAGIGGMVVVGWDVPSSRRAVELAHRYPNVWAAAGIHPHHAKDASDAALEEIERIAHDERVVAIGECGLDFYRDLSPRDAQGAAFAAQLRLARRLELPVVVHTRDSMAQALRALHAHPLPAGGVMHCFDGTTQDARAAVDLGMHVSAAGPLTYRKNSTLAEAIAAVPAERVVVETDCPWLSPAGHRGERNEPAHVVAVAEAVARARGASLADVARQTSENAARLFRVPALAERVSEVAA